jgi:uncharacterized HNH endonuclease L245
MKYIPKQKDCGDGFYSVPETEGIEVNKYGQVRDHLGNVFPGILSGGYLLFCYTDKNGIYRKVRIHRLIASTFISHDYDKPLNELVVNHIDGNKLNNNVSNLEWCTQKENNAHAHRTGLMSKNKPVQIKNLETGEILDFPSIRSASLFICGSEDKLQRYFNYGRLRPFMKKYDIRTLGQEWKFDITDVGKGSVTEKRKVFAIASDYSKAYIFNGIKVAARYIDTPSGSLSWCILSSKNKYHKGLFWAYLESVDKSLIDEMKNSGKLEYIDDDVAEKAKQKPIPQIKKFVIVTDIKTSKRWITENIEKAFDLITLLLGYRPSENVSKFQKNVNYHKGVYKGYAIEYLSKSKVGKEKYQKLSDLLAGDSHQSLS